jgi:hypothetical protein
VACARFWSDRPNPATVPRFPLESKGLTWQWLRTQTDPLSSTRCICRTGTKPGKHCGTRMKPLPWTNGHGRYTPVAVAGLDTINNKSALPPGVHGTFSGLPWLACWKTLTPACHSGLSCCSQCTALQGQLHSATRMTRRCACRHRRAANVQQAGLRNKTKALVGRCRREKRKRIPTANGGFNWLLIPVQHENPSGRCSSANGILRGPHSRARAVDRAARGQARLFFEAPARGRPVVWIGRPVPAASTSASRRMLHARALQVARCSRCRTRSLCALMSNHEVRCSKAGEHAKAIS